jgi:hypothetical protein
MTEVQGTITLLMQHWVKKQADIFLLILGRFNNMKRKVCVVIMIILLALSGCAVSVDSTDLTPIPTAAAAAANTPAPEPIPEATLSPKDPSAIDHIIMSVVYVTKEWNLFLEVAGWPHAVQNKESQGVKFYEAAIWEDTMAIHLYAFPGDYDFMYGEHEGLSTEEKVAYRESFAIKTISDMPQEHEERGPFVLNAFTEFAKILVERHPDATHNLVYSGHGGPGGELFENHLDPTEAAEFLGSWHDMLGHKLGFVDMGTVCMKGSFQDLEAFHEHTDYYIASDLNVGCTQFDDSFSIEIYNKSDTLYQYPRILSSFDNMEEALIERVNLHRLRYEDSINYATENEVMQSQYLYSCSAFGQHKDVIAAFMQSQNYDPHQVALVDIKTALEENGSGAELLAAFDSIIIHGVDTKDFFTWPQEFNGMTWMTYEYDYFE